VETEYIAAEDAWGGQEEIAHVLAALGHAHPPMNQPPGP
jgi:hypothetical protein